MLTFPRTIAGREFPDAPSLAAAVQRDAAAGGGQVVEGSRPSEWLSQALRAGEVERPLMVGLCAALVRASRPAGVVEAAALAASESLTELAPVFSAALAGLDIGVLLHADPRSENASVEDALLKAWAAVEPGDDDRLVHLLDRLRNAGLRAVELAVLARLGSASQITARLPPILVERLPVEDVASLAIGLTRRDVADAVCSAAGPLNASQRYAVWHAAVGLDGRLEAEDSLRQRWLAVDGAVAGGEVH